MSLPVKSVSLILSLIPISIVVLEPSPVKSQGRAPDTSSPPIQVPLNIPEIPVYIPPPIQIPVYTPPSIHIPKYEPKEPKPLNIPTYPNDINFEPSGPVLSKEDRQRYEKWQQECRSAQTQYQSIIDVGNSAAAAGKLIKAENQFNQALQISFPTFLAPEFSLKPQFTEPCNFSSKPFVKQKLGDVLVQQADQLVQQNQLEAANQKYRRSLLFVLSDAPVLQKLEIVLGKQADQFVQQGKADAAIKAYRQLFLLNSNRSEAQSLGRQMIESQPLKAIAYFKIALSSQPTPDQRLDLLLDLGAAYAKVGDYQASLLNYQLAAVQARELGDRRRELKALLGQAQAYTQLGNYATALELYQQVYDRDRIDSLVTKNSQGTFIKVDAIVGFGDIWRIRRKDKQATIYYNQALEIARNLNDSQRIAYISNALSTIQGHPEVTIQSPPGLSDIIQQLNNTLKLARSNRDLNGEIITLIQLGTQYSTLGKAEESLYFYTQALEKQVENNDVKGVVETKEKISELLKENPKLVAQISQKFSQDWLRRMIGFALNQGKPCLALQLADLSKVIEAERSFSARRDIRKSVNNLPEQNDSFTGIEALQQKASQQMQELEQLQQIPEAMRTPEQKRRLEALKPTLIELFELFAQFINSAPVTQRVADTTRNTSEVVSINSTCPILENAAKQQQKKVAFFYPLLLNDNRLALMLYIPGFGPSFKLVPVSRATLTQEVKAFQTAILTKEKDFNLPSSKMRQSAQHLYQRLLEPFESELKLAKVQTIIYASDDILRYVPLAALHTGSRWLIEDYEIQYIVASSITDFNTPPQRDRRVLAGAFATGQVTVPLGKQPIAYTGLTHAKVEIDELKAQIPTTTQLFDRAFSAQTVLAKANQYTLMHFATHASFGGTPDDSYIVFGDGYSTLRSMENWNLQNIDLLTLSACETAFGTQLGDGREILGIGYQIHRAGAKAVLASLWAVQDDSTQVLMDRFYMSFVQGKSKVAAIRQAQLDLLSGKSLSSFSQGSQTASIQASGAGTSQRFDHPYYWAPFILIGNGL